MEKSTKLADKENRSTKKAIETTNIKKVAPTSTVAKQLVLEPLSDELRVAQRLIKSKKIVIVTGAGISVSSGIPDFRSSQGLYDLVKQTFPNDVFKGKELFDASLFKCPQKQKLFYHFMSRIKQLTQKAEPSKTHEFIRFLADNGLLRCYTQNIDDLDQRAGLKVGYTLQDQVVQMHGELETVKCTLCYHSQTFDLEIEKVFEKGTTIPCPTCTSKSKTRVARGQRSVAVGTLRPNIVLYNEHHAKGDDIAKLQNNDLRKADCLIVMGTSLQIVGVKRLIKQYEKRVHSVGGICCFINMTPASKEWDTIFDYQLLGAADDICDSILNHMKPLHVKSEKQRLERIAKRQTGKDQTKITTYFKVEKNSVTVPTKKEKSRNLFDVGILKDSPVYVVCH